MFLQNVSSYKSHVLHCITHFIVRLRTEDHRVCFVSYNKCACLLSKMEMTNFQNSFIYFYSTVPIAKFCVFSLSTSGISVRQRGHILCVFMYRWPFLILTSADLQFHV
jgi:hypothetical protein